MRHLPSSLSSSFAVALLTTAVLDAPRAQACIAEFVGVDLLGETAPATGQTDVPTNARIFFASTPGDLPAAATATVQRGDDEPTPATIETVSGGLILTGVALEPLTTYTARVVLADSAEDLATGDVFEDEAATSEIVFTTGDAADTTPPTWDGDAIVDNEHVPGSGPLEWLFPDDCGPRSAYDIHTITPPAVPADVALIELWFVDVDGDRDVVAAAAPGTPLEDRVYDAATRRYELVAIDIAGNESEPIEVQAAGGGGCSATDENDAGAAAVVTVALALLRRRRRG